MEVLQEVEDFIRDTALRAWYIAGYTEMVVLVFVLILVLAAIAAMHHFTRHKGKLNMPKNQKRHLRKLADRQRVMSIAAYGITSALEEAVVDGYMSRDEATWAYRKFAHAAGMWELIPRRICPFPDPDERKEEIKKRCESGANEPVPLPDRKEPTKIVSFKRKSA